MQNRAWNIRNWLETTNSGQKLAGDESENWETEVITDRDEMRDNTHRWKWAYEGIFKTLLKIFLAKNQKLPLKSGFQHSDLMAKMEFLPIFGITTHTCVIRHDLRYFHGLDHRDSKTLRAAFQIVAAGRSSPLCCDSAAIARYWQPCLLHMPNLREVKALD